MKNGKLSLLFSAYTMVAFHVPFFKDVAANISPNFNGVLIFVSMMIIMLALNFVISYILLYCFRTVGKCILAFLTVGNSICLYFVNTYAMKSILVFYGRSKPSTEAHMYEISSDVVD